MTRLLAGLTSAVSAVRSPSQVRPDLLILEDRGHARILFRRLDVALDELVVWHSALWLVPSALPDQRVIVFRTLHAANPASQKMYVGKKHL